MCEVVCCGRARATKSARATCLNSRDKHGRIPLLLILFFFRDLLSMEPFTQFVWFVFGHHKIYCVVLDMILSEIKGYATVVSYHK